MTEIDLRKYERVDLENAYSDALDVAVKSKGFYSFLTAQDSYWIKSCADTGVNRSLLVSAMSNRNYASQDIIDSTEKSKEDLALIRSKINGRWFSFLFWDSDYLEYNPICLAIWDETEQVWHTRL